MYYIVFLENIFNTSADGIIVTDEVGYIIRTNKALEKITGYTEKELLAIVWALKVFRAYLYGQKVKIFTNHQHPKQQ